MQTCIICGPDKDCSGHPQNRRARPPVETIHIPQGKCPACVAVTKEGHLGSRHLLQSPRQIQDALKVGPVFCYPSQGNKRGVDWTKPLPIRAAATKDGAFCIQLLEGWFYRHEIGEVWMNAPRLDGADEAG